jgi:tetratricopeptide (TPR) repeat protein
MLTAVQLHERGRALSNAGRHAAARRLLTAALQRTDDEDLLARVEGSLAYVVAELGAPDEAWSLCDRALGRPGISAHTRGVLSSQRGLMHMRSGHTLDAVREFTVALPNLDGDDELVGRLLLNRGNVHLQRGDGRSASADFRSARTAFERSGLDVLAAKAEHNLGYCHLLLGDLVQALAEMDHAATILAPLSPVSRAVGAQDKAEVLIAAGLISAGETALAEAAHDYGVRRLRQFQGEAELVLARTQMISDPRSSRRVARQAERRFRGRGMEVWALRARAVALMAEVRSGAQGPALVVAADELLPSLRRERLSVDAANVELHACRVLIRRGDLDAAADRLRKVRLSESAPIGARLLHHEVAADLERARGRRTRSFTRLRQGLSELHAWQSSFGSLDLQSGVVGHGRQLAIDGLRMAVADGRPEVFLEWSERARALASRIIPVRPPADERVSAELSELRWLQSMTPDPRSTEGRRMAELQDSIRQRAWYGDGSHQVAEPVGLAELQDRLADDQALVAYVTTPDGIAALVVTPEQAVVIDVCPRDRLDAQLGGLFPDLDMAASDLPEPFAGPVRRQLASRLGDLADLLVTPLLEAIGDRGLVLTPSGVLAGVPWGLLPGLQGRSVAVAQSATSWLLRQEAPLALSTAGFVAGPRVARAEAEVTAAAGLWSGSTVLTGAAATAAAVTDVAGSVDVLHLSAHGRHSSENPLFSGVELVDGPWFGYDIDQLARVPDVVLLSACEVGRSEVRYGEELIGMTAAWQHAGARTVIASAAAVNDDAAHDVLLGVHQGLRAGLDPAAALAAVLPPPDEGTPPAPFVCFA